MSTHKDASPTVEQMDDVQCIVRQMNGITVLHQGAGLTRDAEGFAAGLPKKTSSVAFDLTDGIPVDIHDIIDIVSMNGQRASA